MSEYDPQAIYIVRDPQGVRCGEVRQGKLYLAGEHEGNIKDGVFYAGTEALGKLEGLTIIRDDDRTPFYLELPEPEQA